MNKKVTGIINIALHQGCTVFVKRKGGLLPVLGEVDVINTPEFKDVSPEDLVIVRDVMTADEFVENTVITLRVPGNHAPVDMQLRHITHGDGYNTHDFHNEDNPNELTASGTIVHRHTGIKFKIPEMS